LSNLADVISEPVRENLRLDCLNNWRMDVKGSTMSTISLKTKHKTKDVIVHIVV